MRWSPRSDAELLAQCGGDREAFTTFYRRYEAGVLGFLARRVGDPQLAADLCAETFAAALVGASSYRPQYESAAPWLFGIARNVLGASLRAGRVEAGARRRLGMLEPLVLTDEDLERIDETATDGTAVLELMAKLPPPQRAALEARVLDEVAVPACEPHPRNALRRSRDSCGAVVASSEGPPASPTTIRSSHSPPPSPPGPVHAYS